MAKFKNKNIECKKRRKNAANTQQPKDDEKVKLIEFKDIFLVAVFCLVALFLIAAIVYAGISIFS